MVLVLDQVKLTFYEFLKASLINFFTTACKKITLWVFVCHP